MMLVAQWADKLYWIVLVAQLPSTIFHNYPTLLLVPSLEFRPIASKLMLPMLLPERLGSSFWEEKEDLKKNEIQFEIYLLNSLIKCQIWNQKLLFLYLHQFCLIPLLFSYSYMTWNSNSSHKVYSIYCH